MIKKVFKVIFFCKQCEIIKLGNSETLETKPKILNSNGYTLCERHSCLLSVVNSVVIGHQDPD